MFKTNQVLTEKSQLETLEKVPEMKKILVRDEFLKLYFENLGVNDSLVVKRHTNYYNILKTKNEEKFRFAIIRGKKTGDIFIRECPEEAMTILNPEKEKRLGVHLLYPDNPNKYDDSINFLSLAYSGFCNVDQNTKLFEPDPFKEKNIPFLNKLIKKLKWENNSAEKKRDYNLLDSFLKSDPEITKEHNRILEEIFGSRLEEITEKDTNEVSYSLFFVKDSTLYEFRAHKRQIYEIRKNVSETKMNETLLDYIVKVNKNEENGYTLENDITVFSELSKVEEEDIANSNKGEIFIYLVISVLFIINFFTVVPQKNFGYLKQTYNKISLFDPYGNDMSINITNFDQVKSFFYNSLLVNLYDEVTNKFNLTKTYTNEDTVNENILVIEENKNATVQEIKLKKNSYYLFNTDFFSGLMINFKHSQTTTITDLNGNDKEVRATSPGYFQNEPVQNRNNFLSFNIKNNNPLYPETYELYFKPTLNKNQLYWHKSLLDSIFDERLYDFSITTLFYNSYYDTVVVLSIQFIQDSYGKMEMKKFYSGFLPFVNKQPNTFLNLMIINVIWIIFFIYICFLNVRNITNNFIELIVNMNYQFRIEDWIDIFYVILSLISQILFYELYLFNSNYFPISLSDFSDFDYWVEYGFRVKDYQRLTGICMLFMMFKFIIFLYDAYPNFGIVFQTLDKAAIEFFSFMAVVGCSLVGIILMSHNAFGWYSKNFEDLERSTVTIYLMFLGMFDYWESFHNIFSYNPIAPYFFIVFMFFFNLILINVFLCIIINNYLEAKEKKHMSNQAYALISADDTKDIYKRIFNLLSFRNPVEVEQEDKFQEEGVIAENKEEFDEKDENDRKKKKSSVDPWTTFTYHLVRLKLRDWFFGTNLKKEEIIMKKKEKYILIRKTNVLNSIEELEVNYEREFDQLKSALCFVFFIIIFILMIFFQLRIGYPTSTIDYIREYLDGIMSNTNFETIDDIQNEITNILEKFYKVDFETYDCNANNDYKMNFTDSKYFFLNPPYFRMTFRHSKYVNNPNEWQNSYFPVRLLNPAPLDENNCGGISEVFDSISEQDQEYYDGTFTSQFIKPGDWTAVNACGGYVLNLGSIFPGCEKDNSINFFLVSSYMFLPNFGSIIMDGIFFSVYYDYGIYFQITILKGTMGEILFQNKLNIIPINRYVTLEDFKRLIIEIIYYFFIIYYFTLEFKTVFNLTKEELIKDYERDTMNANAFEKSSLLNKFIRFDINKYRKESGFSLLCKLVLDFLILILKRIIQLIFILIRSLVQYIVNDYYNVLDILSLFISISMMIKWFTIVAWTTGLDYESKNEDTKNEQTNLVTINILSTLYSEYLYWQSINVFLIFLRMIQYFKFSKSIYALISVLKRASSTIVFHLVIMMIIFLGFALWAYSLYSVNLEDFSTLLLSFFSLFVFIAGKGDGLDDLYQTERIWTTFFIIIFTSLFLLILLNVLFSIVIESYEEIKNTQQQNFSDSKQANFFSNVWTIILEKKKLFFTTCNIYTDNLFLSHNKYTKSCVDIYQNGIAETLIEMQSPNYNNKGFFHKINTLVKLELRFLLALFDEMEDLEKSTLKGYSLFYYKTNLKKLPKKEEDEENKKIKFEESPQKVESTISILTKIMSFIYIDLIGYKSRDYFKKVFLNEHQNIMNIRTTRTQIENIMYNVPSQESQNKLDTLKIKNNILKYNNDYEGNKFMERYTKLFKEMIDTKKGNSFMKENLFDKYLLLEKTSEKDKQQEILMKNYRLSKGTRNFSNLISYDQIFLIENVNFEEMYNLVPNFHRHERGEDSENCEKCEELKNYFKLLSSVVYDLLIKNFYYPEHPTEEDKEIFTAYYLYLFTKDNRGKEVKFLYKEIPNLKRESFENEILFMTNLIHFTPYTIKDLIYTKEGIDLKDEVKENCLLKTLFPMKDFENNEKFFIFQEQLKYYKLFTIWNTLYLILFEKYKNFTLNIRNESNSYKLVKKNKSNFKNLFVNLFNLETRTKCSKLMEYSNNFIEGIENILKQIQLKNSSLEEGFDNSEDFFNKSEKYLLIEKDSNNNLNQIIPGKESDKLLLENEEYPFIFITLWQNFTFKEKFCLYFGYNSFFYSHKINEEMMLSPNFYETYHNYLDCEYYFKPSHQAQILTMLKVHKEFLDILKFKIRKAIENNIIEEIREIDTIQNISDVFKFFTELKTNYLIVFEIVNSAFEDYLSKPKEIVKEIKIKFREVFKIFNKNNLEYMTDIAKKIDFVKFYNLLICKVNFDKLKSKLFYFKFF